VLDLIFGKKRNAQTLHDAARAIEDEGNGEQAFALDQQAIEADPEKSESYYNIGLIYKYRNDWPKSFEYNRRANALDPEDEAARWNLAIAATALRDWATARQAWKDQGITLQGEGPINDNFGQTPVRLNPDGDNAEVVWARRLDPVRARIENIPMPSSGYRCGDIVLHDGAAVGYRMLGDRECAVFNVLELFEPSRLATFELLVDLPTQSETERLLESFLTAELDVEDWTASFRVLCRQCSEGRPHDQHDQHAIANDGMWQVRRRIGIAAPTQEAIHTVLRSWTGPGASSWELTCGLPARQL